ncbi:MAG: redoxin domain-containing protein [Calditrichia bacterium]
MKNRMKMTKLLTLTGLLLSAAFLFMGVAEIGSKATGFMLPGSDGKSHSLSDYSDKNAVVLIFLSTRCPVSNAYNERIVALANDYAAKGVAFIGINSNRNEKMPGIKKHATKNGFTFPVLQDVGNKVADSFDASVTPEVVLLDKSQTIQYHGRIDDSQKASYVKQSDLRLALDALLAAKVVGEAKTNAFGCSIKRVR